MQTNNGRQQALISTANVSMVHSVPELMVSSEVRLGGVMALEEEFPLTL